jgi:adenylate cyclase class 2
MKKNQEIEIKFRIANVAEMNRRLRAAGFKLVTRKTHEMNTLYDLPGLVLRRRGELLRLRKYGETWVLTHKSKGKTGRHKTRVELETEVEDGKGHVVVDETPIGNLGEIEGKSRWIDATAKLLGIDRNHYVTQTYTDLFFEWKRKTGSKAEEMTFKAVAA